MNSVLIVDDNIDHADGLAMILEEEGYDVSIAYSGGDAVEVINGKYHDFVLLDAKLPDMYGVNIYRMISDNKRAGRVIMITGFRIEQLLAEIPGVTGVQIMRNGDSPADILKLVNSLTRYNLAIVTGRDSAACHKIAEELNGNGKKVLLAENPEDIQKADSSNDSVIMDTGENIMDMTKSCLALRERGIDAPVIMFVKKENDNSDVLRCLDATGCLFKPFLPEDLVQVLESSSVKTIKGVHHE